MPDEPARPPTSDAPPRTPRSARSLRPVALGLLGALVGIIGYATFVAPSDEADEARQRRTPTTTTTLGTARSVAVYEAILPSLVDIRTVGTVPGSRGVGSGVVVNGEGLILTALHVVDGASAIEVSFADGTESTAQVESTDPSNDIAVLQPDDLPEVVVPATLGSSGAVEVGDEAFSAGSPLGLAGSFTAGVVSGLGRTIPLEGGSGELDDLIQFDAAVNPGSSGGPLLNRDGQVVGIVTALANPAQQNFFVGLGFAVPIETAGGAAGGPNL